MVLLCLAVTVNSAPQRYQSRIKYFNWTQSLLLFFDAFAQFCILYICWTMGSSAKLRQFNCYLGRNFAGGWIEFQFEIKEERNQEELLVESLTSEAIFEEE